MKDQAKRVEYFALTIDDRPGEGARITAELKKRGINLLAFHGFPTGTGKAQIDLVPEDIPGFMRAASDLGWKLGEKKVAFLIQGQDRVGAMAEIHDQLAQAKINLVAETGICAGGGRYGCILWVAPKDAETTATILGAGALVR